MIHLYYFILRDIGYNNLDIFFGCYSEVHLFVLCCHTSLIQGHKWSSRVPRQGSWDCRENTALQGKWLLKSF